MSEPTTHFLVYCNTSGNGYAKTNNSDGFPDRYVPYIEAMQNTIVQLKCDPCRMLRYEPVKDNRYLLSVTEPDSVGNRNTWKILHFLMEEDDAIAFFRQPGWKVANTTYDCIQKILFPESHDFIDLSAEASDSDADGVCESELLEAAIQGKVARLSYGEDAPGEYMEKQLALIPPNLRHKLSFMIDAPAGLNDNNIQICIKKDAGQPSQSSSYEHLSRIPAEIPLYNHLQFCIYDWNTFKELGLLVKKNEVTLEEVTLENVLKRFHDDTIVEYIQSPAVKLTREDLVKLCDATKRKFSFHKSPIYKAAMAVLTERSKKNKASGQRVPEAAALVEPRRKADLSCPLFLLFTAVCFMSTALLLVGASPNWSLLSLPTGLAAGCYLGRLRTKVKRR